MFVAGFNPHDSTGQLLSEKDSTDLGSRPTEVSFASPAHPARCCFLGDSVVWAIPLRLLSVSEF